MPSSLMTEQIEDFFGTIEKNAIITSLLRCAQQPGQEEEGGREGEIRTDKTPLSA